MCLVYICFHCVYCLERFGGLRVRVHAGLASVMSVCVCMLGLEKHFYVFAHAHVRFRTDSMCTYNMSS